MGNLTIAWRKARKGKTKKPDIIKFEKHLEENLIKLHQDLRNLSYKPRPLTTFILADPKTRKISKSDFRDRVVHHAIINLVQPEFEKSFIYDSCANQKAKGTSFALQRFEKYLRKVTKSNKQHAFCLKADIKHYFQEVNHEILIKILKRKIKDSETINLIKKILNNLPISEKGGETHDKLTGMPLGNLTSQAFANIYLHDLDFFIKHKLKAKYYIRYVDDFVILHHSKSKLESWKNKIYNFLNKRLKLKLHPQKSRIVSIHRGIDFIGFRNFCYYKLLRKRNIRNIKNKISNYKLRSITFSQLKDSYQGWQAYAKWANTYKLRNKVKKEIVDIIWNKI